jgi:Aerobic-type carbon monoxide dehydrogenase, middle subunit CoxM/CutM homologs
MAVALTAVGAKIVIAGPDAMGREVAVADLYTPLGTTLERGEFVTEVRVPPSAQTAKVSFLKFTVREPVDFAVVSVAANITFDGGICTDARIVLGAVGPGPHRATEAEELLCGKRLDVEIAEKAGAAALAGAKPLRKNGYKVEIAKTLVKRAIMECAQV